MSLQNLSDFLDRKIAEHTHALRQVDVETAAVAAARERVRVAREAQTLVNEAARAVQQAAHRRIASVVTRALQAVFGEDSYELQIAFEKKRGKTEARLLLGRGGRELEPTESVGGGVLDLCAFALRCACLVLSCPGRRRLLVADEPFKHLSREYRPRVRELLDTLAAELGVQILYITHDPALQTGKVLRLGD